MLKEYTALQLKEKCCIFLFNKCLFINMKNENQDPQILQITKKDDEIKELKYKTEKPDHENI